MDYSEQHKVKKTLFLTGNVKSASTYEYNDENKQGNKAPFSIINFDKNGSITSISLSQKTKAGEPFFTNYLYN